MSMHPSERLAIRKKNEHSSADEEDGGDARRVCLGFVIRGNSR